MAYQPLYAKIDDGIGTEHTHSCRGKVDNIYFWLNSQFGEVMRIYANSDGSLTEKSHNRIYVCKNRIKQFQETGNLKKIEEWENKLKLAEQEYQTKEKWEKVVVKIDIADNPKFMIDFGGVEINLILRAIKDNPKIVEELKALIVLHKLNEVNVKEI